MLILKIKNIILIYFQVKNILKNNLYHNFKLTLNVCLILYNFFGNCLKK